MPLENQGGPATASPSPTATTQQTVTIPLEQLQTFTSIQARLAEMESAQRTQQEAAQQEQARILAQKGEVENALRMLREQSEQTLGAERQRLVQVEERAKRYALDGEISRALSSHNLVQGGAEQLSQLWRSQFLVDTQGDSFAVRTPDVPVGGRVRVSAARPTGVRPLRPGLDPGGYGDRPDDPGGPDAARQPDAGASAQEHGRGSHPPHAGPPEDPGRRPGQPELAHGAAGGSLTLVSPAVVGGQ